jgi:hypothetical protein
MKEAIEKSTVNTVTVTMERTIVPTETSLTTITSLITIKGGVEEWNRTIVLLLILLIVSIVSIILGRVLGKKK